MSAIDPDFMDDVADAAVAKCMELLLGVTDAMSETGMVYGDEKLSREERIANYLDMEERGVLTHLRVVNRKLFERTQRQFERDMANEPMERE